MIPTSIKSVDESSILSKYSVLMSVYCKDDPTALCDSIDSILNQTVATDDFVIICDGPLTEQLDEVLAEYDEHPSVHIHRLSQNKGLGDALAYGLPKCKHHLIARMDSDDISVPQRCELELEAFREHPELDIVSGAIVEFNETPEDGTFVRIMPREHQDIIEMAKRRNPLNHVTVMYRKDSVLEAGNYQRFDRVEDYYLWVRMFNNGCLACNLDEVLVYVRVGNGMQARRAGFSYIKSQLAFQQYLKKCGFITTKESLTNCAERFAAALMPAKVRAFLYERLLRTNKDNSVT